MEIAAKIASKIKNGEIFRAFIVIPMFPEGKRNFPRMSHLHSAFIMMYRDNRTKRVFVKKNDVV